MDISKLTNQISRCVTACELFASFIDVARLHADPGTQSSADRHQKGRDARWTVKCGHKPEPGSEDTPVAELVAPAFGDNHVGTDQCESRPSVGASGTVTSSNPRGIDQTRRQSRARSKRRSDLLYPSTKIQFFEASERASCSTSGLSVPVHTTTPIRGCRNRETVSSPNAWV